MGDIKTFADSLTEFRKGIEEDARKDLLRRMERLFNRYRSYSYAGFDVTLRGEETMMEDFEKALDLLSECHEELTDD